MTRKNAEQQNWGCGARWIVFFMLLLIQFGISFSAYPDEAINENFESLSIGPIDGQGNWASGDTGGRDSIAEIVSSPTHGGSRSLHLSGFVANATYTANSSASSNTIISFWYREQYGFGTNDTGNNSSSRTSIFLTDGYNSQVTVASICHAGTGHRSLLLTDNWIGNGQCVNGVGDMTEGNWYNIQIHYDFENKIARARINSGNWGNSINLQVNGGPNGNYIKFLRVESIWDNPPQFWFDDFSQTSISYLPSTILLGPPGGPANPSGSAAEPVNTATGNYYYSHTDLTLPGRGLGLAFTHTYNAQDATDGPFGRGWTHRYHVRLTENPDGSVVIRHGDGHEAFFDPNGDGSYTSRYPGVYDTLTKLAAGSFLLAAKDQTRHAFTDGRLTQLSDRNGNALSFGYDAAGQLITITDTAGRVITLGYNANGRLILLSGPLGRNIQYEYDANGDLSSDTDPAGGIMHYSYDGNRRLTRITNRRGQVLVNNGYDGAGRVVSQTNGRGLTTLFAYDRPNPGDTTITNPLGQATIHRHDDQRRLIAEIDPLGHSVQYGYDTGNNRTQVTDRNGNVTLYSYDPSGNVLTQTDPLNQVTTLSYDASNNPLTRTDALGQTTAFSYNAAGNLLSETNPLGQITRYTYDGHGQRLSRTDGNGHTRQYGYDSQGNRATVTDPLGQTTPFAYDPAGRPIRVTDANGHATTFSYDGNDRLLTATDALNHTVAYAYDADGNRTRITDPKGQATLIVYDANDNIVSITDPTGAVTAYSYDNADRRLTLTDPRGHVTTYGYDAAQRLIAVTNALNQTTTYRYDSNGNPLGETNPLGQIVTFQYDALNRLTRVADPLGNPTAYQYDALGRRAALTDAQGRTTRYDYDALNRLAQITDPAGNLTSVDYDAAGNRLSVTNPNGNPTLYTYDAADRRTLEANALNQFTAWQYDAAGNPTQRTDARGQLTQYGHDAADRLASIRYADTTTVTFGRDANGNVTQMVDPLGATTYAYDSRNRLIDHTDPYGATVRHDYDLAGNRTLLIYPDGQQVRYGYDALNRLTTVTDWRGAITDYHYDAAGNLAGHINHGNGTQAIYGYDAASRLTGLLDQRTNNQVIARYDLTLDTVGNRIEIASQDPVAPRYLSQDTAAAYAYDAADRLATLGASPVSHDANGNLLNQPGGSYQYDGDNRLTVTNSQGYAYDGQGRRLAAIRGATTRYVLDLAAPLSQVLMERDGAGNPTASYVYGLGLIARIAPSGDARYYHYDARGNTVALTDAGGLLTDAYAYSPFGEPLAQQGTTPNPFRFLGQFGVMHEGDGINYVRARYYHPATGRFLSQDPICGTPAAGQTLNPYAYALNNPVRFVDVSGLSAREGTSRGLDTSSDDLHDGLLAAPRRSLSSFRPLVAYAAEPSTAGQRNQPNDTLQVTQSEGSGLMMHWFKTALSALPKAVDAFFRGFGATAGPTVSGAISSVGSQGVSVGVEMTISNWEVNKFQKRSLQNYVLLLDLGYSIDEVMDSARIQNYLPGLSDENLKQMILEEAQRQGVNVK